MNAVQKFSLQWNIVIFAFGQILTIETSVGKRSSDETDFYILLVGRRADQLALNPPVLMDNACTTSLFSYYFDTEQQI